MLPPRVEGDEVIALAPDGKAFAGMILEVDEYEGEPCYFVASVDDEGELDGRIGGDTGECCAERHIVEGWGIAKPKLVDIDKPLRRSRKVHFFIGRYYSLCLGWKWRGNGDRLRPTLTDDQVQKGAFCARCEKKRRALEKERARPLLETQGENQ